MVVGLSKDKGHPRTVAFLCKDHNYGIEIPTQESRKRLAPLVHEIVQGIYFVDGLFPGDVATPPLCLLCSCRAKWGWDKRLLQPAEVISLYDIID
jgi:hypothetical protein